MNLGQSLKLWSPMRTQVMSHDMPGNSNHISFGVWWSHWIFTSGLVLNFPGQITLPSILKQSLNASRLIPSSHLKHLLSSIVEKAVRTPAQWFLARKKYYYSGLYFGIVHLLIKNLSLNWSPTWEPQSHFSTPPKTTSHHRWHPSYQSSYLPHCLRSYPWK